jgi:endoglucanase
MLAAVIFLWGAACAAEALAFDAAAQPGGAALWEDYRANFISVEGRVIDYYRGQISHSEGQGYAMLLAVAFDDRGTFDRVWDWTRNNLRVRQDRLFAWQWGRRPNGKWDIMDYNNATDGDVLIAHALLKASDRWLEGAYKAEALKGLQDIRKRLAVDWNGRTLLLPSYHGFTGGSGIVMNPSYLILPAYRRFAQADDRAFWDKAHGDAVFLLGESSFGRLRLPADWILVSGDAVTIHGEKRPYYGFEAIRTLLHLSGEKAPRFPEGLKGLLDMYAKLGYIPLWVDLEMDSFSLQSAPAGYYAVYALAARKAGDAALSARLLDEARSRLPAEKDDYYSRSLFLLAYSEAIA